MDKFSFIRGKTTNKNVLSSTVTEKSIAVMLSDGTEIEKSQIDNEFFQKLIVSKCSNHKVDAYQLTPNMASFSGSDSKITGCASVKATAEDGATLSQDAINKAKELINEKIGNGVELTHGTINWNGSGDADPVKTNIKFTLDNVECNKSAVFRINGNVKKYEFTVAANKSGDKPLYRLHQTDDNGKNCKTNSAGFELTEANHKINIGTVAEKLTISAAPTSTNNLGLAKMYEGHLYVAKVITTPGSTVNASEVTPSIPYDTLHDSSNFVYLITATHHYATYYTADDLTTSTEATQSNSDITIIAKLNAKEIGRKTVQKSLFYNGNPTKDEIISSLNLTSWTKEKTKAYDEWNVIGDRIYPANCIKRDDNKVYYGWYCPEDTYEEGGTSKVEASNTSSSHTYYSDAISSSQEVQGKIRYDRSSTKYYTREIGDDPIRISKNANVVCSEEGTISNKNDGNISYVVSDAVTKSVLTD